MVKTKTAKLFKNGASQAVRLPLEFRFDSDEVYITRDDQTGDVLLSNRPSSQAWREFFELADSAEIPADFMSSRPMNRAPVERDLFPAERGFLPAERGFLKDK